VAPDSGRLSGSKKTQLAKRPPLPFADPKLRSSVLLGAADAVRIVRRLGFDALGRPPASPPVALVPIKAVAPSSFDRATQRLFLEVLSEAGPSLPVVLHYKDDKALWFDNLEKMAKAKTQPKALFARFLLDSGGFRIEPLTAYYAQGPAQHLTHRPLEVNG
jgi:hypothetical protein